MLPIGGLYETRESYDYANKIKQEGDLHWRVRFVTVLYDRVNVNEGSNYVDDVIQVISVVEQGSVSPSEKFPDDLNQPGQELPDRCLLDLTPRRGISSLRTALVLCARLPLSFYGRH